MKYLNNPLNIRYSETSNWRGQIEPKNGFCQFSSLEYGVRAALLLLSNYRYKRGLKNVSSIISRWAPDNENDTKAYVAFVVGQLLASPRQFFYIKVSDLGLKNRSAYADLVVAMAKMESNTTLTHHYVLSIANKYKIFKTNSDYEEI